MVKATVKKDEVIVDESELTAEEQAALNELNAGSNNIPQLPFLSINKSPVDDEGKDIPIQTFTINKSGVYSKEVKFRPMGYYNRLLDMRQDTVGKWKTNNETIYFKQNEEPIDAAGGVGCGRILGKATNNFTEAQLKANKSKAQFYGYLFGIVTFPGQEPTVCSFRLPAGKAVTVGKVLQKLTDRPMYTYELNFKLVPNKKDRQNLNPDIEVSYDPNLRLSTSGIGPIVTQITSFIKASNEKIRASHVSARKQLQGTVTSTYAANNTPVDSEQNDLDDEIPF